MRASALLFAFGAFSCSDVHVERFPGVSVIYTTPIEATKNEFDWVNPLYTERPLFFPEDGEPATVDCVLVEISRRVYLDDVVRTMRDLGFRPATLAELRGFRRRYPAATQRYKIFALGSLREAPGVLNDRWTTFAPWIYPSEGTIGLNIDSIDDGWDSREVVYKSGRFLGVVSAAR